MKNKIIVAGLAASFAGLGLTCAAQAKTYEFDITTAAFMISGDVLTSNTLNVYGGYDVTGISGSVVGPGGASISGLVFDPIGDAPYTGGAGPWIYDNILYTQAPPYVDNPGILFSAGAFEYNVYTVGTTYYVSTNNTGGEYNPGEVLLSGTVTAVPELQTWALMGIGFAGLGLAGVGRTKKGRAAVAAA